MIFSICFYVTLFGREIWPVKVEDVIRLEGNDARWFYAKELSFPRAFSRFLVKKNFPEKSDSVSSQVSQLCIIMQKIIAVFCP